MSADGQNQSLEVNINHQSSRSKPVAQQIKRLIKDVCARFNVEKGVVNLTILDDEGIRLLNKRHLGRDAVTDCLSFDLSERDGDVGEECEFEVIVNSEQAAREANKRGHSEVSELALYVIHGLLHNLGFDDGRAEEADRMHRTEDEILEESGYGRVYDS